jgi:hypothetical protein
MQTEFPKAIQSKIMGSNTPRVKGQSDIEINHNEHNVDTKIFSKQAPAHKHTSEGSITPWAGQVCAGIWGSALCSGRSGWLQFVLSGWSDLGRPQYKRSTESFSHSGPNWKCSDCKHNGADQGKPQRSQLDPIAPHAVWLGVARVQHHKCVHTHTHTFWFQTNQPRCQP